MDADLIQIKNFFIWNKTSKIKKKIMTIEIVVGFVILNEKIVFL